MKFRIIVEERVQRLSVIPESEEEQRFLGVLVPKPDETQMVTTANVDTRYDAHYSDRKVKSMEFVFTGKDHSCA